MFTDYFSLQIRFIIDDTRHIILDESETSETQRVVIGKVSRFLSIKCADRVRPWVELELGDLLDIRDGFLEFHFSKRRFYLPFG